MNTFLKQITNNQLVDIKNQIIENHSDVFCQIVRKEYSIEEFMDGIRESIKDPAEGKVLLALWWVLWIEVIVYVCFYFILFSN